MATNKNAISPDIKRVIQGLELCTIDLPLDNNIHQEDFCQNCPYHNSNTTFCFAKVDLMRDALQLIKAQNEVIKKYQKADVFLAVHGWKWEKENE